MATSVGRENQAMIEGIAWYCSLAQGILSREIERMQNAEKGWVTNRSEVGSLRESVVVLYRVPWCCSCLPQDYWHRAKENKIKLWKWDTQKCDTATILSQYWDLQWFVIRGCC